MDKRKQPGLKVAQIFLESASFAHRKDFLRFPPGTPITVEIQVTLTSGISPDQSKGRIQLQARSSPDADALYHFDVTMTALVETDSEANLPLDRYLATNGGALVFPFLREVVANLTARGRFGPVWLAPINLTTLEAEPESTSSERTARAGAVGRSTRGRSGRTPPRLPKPS